MILFIAIKFCYFLLDCWIGLRDCFVVTLLAMTERGVGMIEVGAQFIVPLQIAPDFFSFTYSLMTERKGSRNDV